MAKINVFLVCGGGASSGFMATSLRKAAKKRGIELEAKAMSETEIEDYIDEASCIMLGPHLAYLEEDIRDRVKDYDVKVLVMSGSYYSSLDGDEALDHMLKTING